MKYILSVAICLVFLMPMVVGAQAGGLVTCSGSIGDECNACHLVDLVNGVINWLISILSIIAVIGIVISGFQMVTSGGNESAWTNAKARFTNVLLGFILVLAAWLIVDTVLLTLTGSGLVFWGKVDC